MSALCIQICLLSFARMYMWWNIQVVGAAVLVLHIAPMQWPLSPPRAL